MNPQFYSFRWITLLLSQEFDLPDVLRLWDALFADAERFNLLYYCCMAMLQYVRSHCRATPHCRVALLTTRTEKCAVA